MNEATSIFMTMIESTLNKMIDARIEAKMENLLKNLHHDIALAHERITILSAALEKKMGSVMNCQDNDHNGTSK